ncbi:hypothetical protein [Actinocorallia sp. A-T 12471]|uniref:hypothetical protein n=1 Tax=Actinocorallia sp. A-T 12471 TaxID=3089813 RepID=UPI0029D37675|nr:hypothetical protein [Actinocorallia sp. A-T 12471]MDX6741237.1 hypothetical protein [Actinocorallia sp. A-T 12471]
MIVADHSVTEAIALFVPALAIVSVIAGAVIIDRRRGAAEEAAQAAEPAAEAEPKPSES